MRACTREFRLARVILLCSCLGALLTGLLGILSAVPLHMQWGTQLQPVFGNLLVSRFDLRFCLFWTWLFECLIAYRYVLVCISVVWVVNCSVDVLFSGSNFWMRQINLLQLLM